MSAEPLHGQEYLVIYNGISRVMVTQGGSTRYYAADVFEQEVRPQLLEEQTQVLTDAGLIDPETGELMPITDWPMPAYNWPTTQGGTTQNWQENPNDGTMAVILSQHGDGGGNDIPIQPGNASDIQPGDTSQSSSLTSNQQINPIEEESAKSKITADELGIKGEIEEFDATFKVEGSKATLRVDMISGDVANPFEVFKNIVDLARSRGVSQLRIEATIVNPKLYDAIGRRYGLQTKGGNDYLEIDLSEQ